jgi:O-antigen/teichoic acid export membrane protein
MVQTKTITQNASFYTTALIIQKVLAFIYFTFLARYLPVDDLGKYTFAFSFTTIFSVLVDVGLSAILTREIAKNKEKEENLLANILGLKIILSVAIYALIILLINLLGYLELTKKLVYLTGVIMLLDNFSLTWWGVLRGHENLKYESIGITLFQIIVVSLGGILIWQKANVIYLVSVILLASLFNCIFSYCQMRWRLKLVPKIDFNKRLLKNLLKISWPFALAGIFARLNTQIDTVFLSKLGCSTIQMCETNIGIYSVATKITLALHFIPLAFTAALFPAMSKLFVEDKEKLVRTFEKSMHYLMIVGIPISIGIGVLAPDFLPKVFGQEFTNSILPLQILMASLSIIFLTFPIGALLNATSRQLRNTLNIGIAVIVNIVLNLILIPFYSYTGAAIASLTSSIIILVLGLISINKVIKYNKKYLVVNFIKILISAGVMGIVLWQLLFKFNFAILTILGVIIYFVVLILIGGIKKSNLTDILISLKIKKN